MAKIPIPGPHGTSWIEIDPPALTPKEQKELYELHKRCDERLGEVYVGKMTALGYDTNLEVGIKVYKDPTERKRIDDEYFGLEQRNRWNDVFSSLEKIIRDTER